MASEWNDPEFWRWYRAFRAGVLTGIFVGGFLVALMFALGVWSAFVH